MKKILAAIAVLLFLAPAAKADSVGQRFGDALLNPVVVAGAKYLTTAPDLGARTQFLLTANVPGFRLIDNLYLAGVGVQLQTVVPGLENAAGAGISVPALTYFFNGSQFVAQVGYGWDLMQTPATGGVYAGLGFSFTGSATQKAKRLAKEEAKRKAAAKAAAGVK